MNSNHRNILSTAAVALLAMSGGFFFGAQHAQYAHATTAARDDLQTFVSRPAQPAPRDATALALHDMHGYALRHLGVWEEDLQSFGNAEEWSPEWELRWMDVRHDGEAVRVYHLTGRREPHLRYTTMWVGDVARWEQAY